MIVSLPKNIMLLYLKGVIFILDIYRAQENYLYHFTSSDTCISYILRDQKLRLSSINKTNDPRENKEWYFGFGIAEEEIELFEHMDSLNLNKQINELLKEDAKLICFTKDKNVYDPNAINEVIKGCLRPRMWAQYGDSHKGICLVFDQNKLESKISNTFNSDVRFFGENVQYSTDFHNLRLNIKFNSIKDDLEAGVYNHLSSYYKDLFFEKFIDWQDETEFRWVVFTKNESGFEYVDYQDSLVHIVLGADFNDAYLPLIKSYCEKFKVHCSKINWHNGIPLDMPIYDECTVENSE
ncbi:DUF2971 domain-containing protein [Alkalicoccobacillus plakortidis]|uniref:DUF2971 domain-containing protein n=1 Tax=Alkalicoccobacillus plakortidis TaxID=444060 RepID=A0ABT0XI48_9BACI|nr:DUF2971 domain-containing protein [Alkalicoccobacillus plakortidis]MCM2675564.1 DUF2971 domain-containing protein [Alkalicoccobacillus plakortidis]